MRTEPSFSQRVVSGALITVVVTACSLEVNVHLDGSDDDAASVDARLSIPAPPEAPTPPELTPPGITVWPIPPEPVDVTTKRDRPVSDALWRPWELEAPFPPPALEEGPELSAAPTFTPFTVAPSILNREEVVRAMTDAYPPLLRDAGIGGTARIYFFIEEDGSVGRTVLDQSSGHAALDDAALAVADVYRFSPARNRDEPVPVWVSFPITFQVR